MNGLSTSLRERWQELALRTMLNSSWDKSSILSFPMLARPLLRRTVQSSLRASKLQQMYTHLLQEKSRAIINKLRTTHPSSTMTPRNHGSLKSPMKMKFQDFSAKRNIKKQSKHDYSFVLSHTLSSLNLHGKNNINKFVIL
jgi:hypothetical protein